MSAPDAPRVFADERELGQAAAQFVAACAAHAIAARGAFRFALPGGRSPRAMLAALASAPHRTEVDWASVTVLLADERALPPADPGSNAHLVREALLDPLGASAPRFARMHGESSDLAAAAHAYEKEVSLPLDLLVLGVGEDGHVASLFPGSPLLDDVTRRVAAVLDSPKPPARRLTLLPRAIAEARAVLALASGAGKAVAVAAALAPGADPHVVPAALVRGGQWLLDREAAARLPGAGTGS